MTQPILTATAPGKIMLSGEYAVLDGAEAVLIGVNRHVHARVSKRAPAMSPFLRAALREVAQHAGTDSRAARAAARIDVDSSALRAPDGTKLGLGSSAASTVAAVARALCEELGPGDSLLLPLVHRLAHAAHGRAQERRGARGSGADIAASVYGGVLAVHRAPRPEFPVRVRPLALPRSVHLVYLWTGIAADTPALVETVQSLREHNRSAYDRAVAAIGDASSDLCAAFERGDAASVVAAIAAGRRAVAGLGEAASVTLETPMHAEIARLAEASGGAAKPTGAGAGDIAVAAFASAQAAAKFCDRALSARMMPLDLAIAEAGVQSEFL